MDLVRIITKGISDTLSFTTSANFMFITDIRRIPKQKCHVSRNVIHFASMDEVSECSNFGCILYCSRELEPRSSDNRDTMSYLPISDGSSSSAREEFLVCHHSLINPSSILAMVSTYDLPFVFALTVVADKSFFKCYSILIDTSL